MAKPEFNKEETKNLYKQIKDQSNLVSYIENKTGTNPKRTGQTWRFNPCPFCGHDDCFSVFGENHDGYKCYSCEAAGDIFTFAETFERLSKGQALREVAGACGFSLPAPDNGDSPAETQGEETNLLQEVLEAAVTYYRGVLAKKTDSMAYLTTDKPDGRGHNQRTIDAMEIGFTDGNLATALQQQGITLDTIKQSGLYVERQKDGKPSGEWRDYFVPGMFIFPHRNESGQIGHFTIKDPRKKIDYQLKTENRLNGLLWGNQRAITSNTIIISEGENDQASFFDVGVRNVMPTLGQLSEAQIRWLLTRSNDKHFVLWFDYDTKYGDNFQPPAGIKYTRKLYNHLMRQPDCTVSVASALWRRGRPDDFIQKDKATAAKRIQTVIKKAHHPLLWELKVMPTDIREDANATLHWLDEIDFFELLGLVTDLQRDAIVLELQKLGFSRDAVLDNIKAGFGLADQLQQIEEAYNIGESKSKLPESFMRLCSKAIWDYFKNHGKFFVSNETLHLFYHHKIYTIGSNTAWEALLHKEANLNSTQQLAKYVHAEIKSLCYNRGDRLEAFSWVHMLDDGNGPTVYMNLKDPANRILKLSAGNAELLENGTNPHAVLLAESSQMKEFLFDPEVNVAAGMRDLKALFFDAMTCEPAQRSLVLAWALSSYLMPITQTKALMKMEGGSGSGKTTAARISSLLLYGADMVGRSTTAGDYSMGSTEPLIIKDNLETDDINKQALNFLLLAATGATNIKRSSGTESGVTTEKLSCPVCITAIEPFAKPELINRTYIVDFSKRFQRTDFVETANNMKLLGKRNEILSAWIQLLAEEILPNLDQREHYIKYIREQHKNFSKDRTAEFMAVLALISKVLIKYMPLPDEMKIDAGDRSPEYVLLDEWIRYQNAKASNSEQGTNAVLQLLEGLRRCYLIDFARSAADGAQKVWCPMMGMDVHKKECIDPVEGPTGLHSYSFEASTSDLLAMMQRYGREYGTKVTFQNARQLGVRINNEMLTLEEAGWTVTKTKVVHGTRYATFEWRDDANTAPKAQ